jgi:hypothetical protein
MKLQIQNFHKWQKNSKFEFTKNENKFLANLNLNFIFGDITVNFMIHTALTFFA